MENSLAIRLVPDDLWELVEPLLPRFDTHRQGGGTAPIAGSRLLGVRRGLLTYPAWPRRR
ncbi:hypothetical protein BL254_04905 [Protofrankia sp. BMG5.30]|uniref:Transposase of IS4/5 family n=2 Tax=Protofrankia coriariae TaxID=1562887 RepID=A0ABR5F5X1_9ACTN|nr:hypothetical protein FrCorBMG51_06570 [Protofrankia coriariae]ONH37006.1 hypothetical protein BL254_04905 [Protofrankia sp. BMG5.30]